MTIENAVRDFSGRISPVREKKLVAVSGGRDSVALLHALHASGHHRLVVCHLNHCLRGRASAGDAAFVEKLAARLGLPVEIGSALVKREAAAGGVSLETAGRQARHRFLAECAARHRCRRVVLAHHADDQAETILFNLFRGSAGLRGMDGQTFHLVTGHRSPLEILRPMLQVTRQEVDRYMTLHRLRFREDATNAVAGASRNKLRLELLPAICTAMGRDVRPLLLRAQEIAAEEDRYMESMARPLSEGDTLNAAAIRKLPVALQRRVLHHWMRHRHTLPGIGFDEVESVRAMLVPDGPRAVNLSGNHFIRRRKGVLSAE